MSFVEGRGRTALITGASAGIGSELARVVAAKGFDLVLTARRAERLAALGDELGGAHGARVRIMPADLALRETPAALIAALALPSWSLWSPVPVRVLPPVARPVVQRTAATPDVAAAAAEGPAGPAKPARKRASKRTSNEAGTGETARAPRDTRAKKAAT